jgi:ABC-2 type transport system permease protein
MMQRVFALTKMLLKKVIREPAYLFLMILFPVALTLTFGLAFGAIGTSDTSSPTMFDFMAPGLFAYACIFIIMLVAQSFTDDREQGLLKRINVTPTTSGQFMGSHLISNMIIAIIQVAVVFIMSLFMGYRPLGGIIGVLMAFVFMILLSLCSVGLGLITASISKSSGAATGISFIFILPQMFFGTFIPLTPTTEIIAAFLPSYYVTSSLSSILNEGSTINSEILINLGILAIMSVIIIIIGMLLFKKYSKN